MTGAVLEVTGLGYSYPDGHRVLEDVNLSLQPGDRLALLGPNGAGKTTLALHLNGILTPDTGSVRLDGMTIAEPNLSQARSNVGIVFHDANDQLFMPTVRADVGFGPSNLGLSKAEVDRRVEEALAAVDASELIDRTPHHLSAGEKRRVALATVLSMKPKVLVLDEPTSGLDPTGRRELARLLVSLTQTQLVITHDLPFACELCPNSAVMSRGRIEALGPTTEILRDTDLLNRHNLELPYRWSPPD